MGLVVIDRGILDGGNQGVHATAKPDKRNIVIGNVLVIAVQWLCCSEIGTFVVHYGRTRSCTGVLP